MTLRCVSLFSGCGGLDLGLQRAGFELAFATDSEAHCARSHRANFKDVPFLESPIEEVVEDDLKGVLNRPVHLLAGGPPCPPFSKSRFYRSDLPRALADPLASTTLGGFLRVLEFVRPTTFLLENVPGFRYVVHRDALEFLEAGAAGLGYTTSAAVLNAADYGVPQTRERFFMIGSRLGAVAFPSPSHSRLGDGGLPRWRTSGDVLRDLDTEANAEDDGHFAGGQYHHLLRLVPPGGNYLHFTAKRGCPDPKFEWRSRYWSFLLKLDPDAPSWTIQARRSNNMGPFHWRNRILRIEEVKRLQTFPDDWQLSGSVAVQWRQLGNAVPPTLAEALGSAIREHLESSVQAGEAVGQSVSGGGVRGR